MIEVKNIKYKDILKDISFNVKKGEFISLIGGNGSGKSTLALAMSGLIEVSGDINKESKVAIVFENPDNQLIGTTVEEDIAFGLQNLPMTREQISNKIDETLKLLGIEELKEREIITLSGGQKQKVAFASLLALDYDIYILDEVTSMVDPESKELIYELIDKLHTEGKTLIQITHFMDEVEKTERTILIKDGKIEFDGNTKEFLSDKKRLEENGLV